MYKLNQKALNLIELAIAFTIIGILAVIVIPMYLDYVTRSRRADGQATLMQVAQELERCYKQFSKYNDDSCSVVSKETVHETSSQGYYLVTAHKLGESTFTLIATPQNDQTDDTDCTTLTLTHLGIENATGANPGNCW